MDQKTRINFGYLLLALIGIVLARDLWQASQAVESISYDRFQQYLAEGRVQELVIGTDRIEGRFKPPAPEGRPYFVTNRVDPELAQQLSRYKVTFSGQPPNRLLGSLLSWLLPALLFLGLWYFLIRRLAERQGGFMNIGKSRAKVYVETDTRVGFADVAGVDEAKAELQEVVDFLKDPQGHGRLGARLPKGVLLVGPPGTGKTLLARAVAGEAKVPFFSINGSEFVEMFVGIGAARVRDLFEQARAQAPCIIFIDELDALGRARSLGPWMGGHDEKEQTLNQLLAEIDGFDPGAGVVLLAATNRPEILDPALLRPGRFDRQVLVDRPDKAERVAILQVHLRRICLAPGVEPEQLAALTPGFTGADLANLVNEAALLATRRNAETVEMGDFTAAIERLVAGLEKRHRLLTPHEREVVAHHEMGHALIATALPGCDPVQKVSIIPRGVGALGYTLQRPLQDRYLLTRSELENRLTVMLGGRAAELLVFGEASTGAADDLQRATELARAMVTRYGMDARLGPISYESAPGRFLPGAEAPVPGEHSYGDSTAREIDQAVHKLIDEALARAEALLRQHRDALTDGARRLLEKETLSAAELPSLTPAQDAATNDRR